jgi:hypothetical protein
MKVLKDNLRLFSQSRLFHICETVNSSRGKHEKYGSQTIVAHQEETNHGQQGVCPKG